MIIFCDIDGVLFDISHRLHYQQSGDYESFYSDDALAGDSIINGGVSLVMPIFLPLVIKKILKDNKVKQTRKGKK